MTNPTDMKERVAANNRLQTLRAMDRIVIQLGGKIPYVNWLNAMPDDVSLSDAGGISASALTAVSEDETVYQELTRTFATIMAPVLERMAQ